MTRSRLLITTALAMLAFAGNSLLCRAALQTSHIDATSFTTIRLVAGALTLWLIVRLRDKTNCSPGSIGSALALFAYAIFFSFAYVGLPAATGALLLFGAVQATMIGYGLWRGERLPPLGIVGVLLAFGGLIGLVLPGVTAPPLLASALMLLAGVAWGAYSLRGRVVAGDPTQINAGNFLRALPYTLIVSALLWKQMRSDVIGVVLAIASGAMTSGVGYAIWYAALPGLQATQAAVVQLSVPVIAALGGVLLLGESMTLRLVVASLAILGGIALVIVGRARLK